MFDAYWPEPQGNYDERRRLYLEYCAAQSPGGRTGFFSQIARLELGRDPVDEGSIRAGIDYVYSRQDCCDFSVGGFLRILYRYHDSPLIAPEVIAEIETCLLRFKYWWDEAQGDNQRCYHTENHQIIFHADELLAGQYFRGQIFENSGKDADYHIAHALHLINRWFDFRAQFGFSEWLSNCYFEEDMLALVNLYDFAEQPDVRRKAGQFIDMLLFEQAMHSYRGILGCTHGRTYPHLIKGGRSEDAASTNKLMFGMGVFTNPTNLGTVPLATSGYRCPAAIERIALDFSAPRLYKERHSINMDDAPKYGLSYDNMEDGHLFWSIQDYTHAATIDLAQQTRQTYGIGLYEDYQTRYDATLAWQLAQYGDVIDRNIDCHGLTEVHIQTYRTADFLLSCAQDYRPGKPGYQQHPWQATLGVDAVVFTNHPGSNDEFARPNYWAGNGILPRAIQQENVLICIHHAPTDDAFPFSHAYFPRDTFDEVIEAGPWVCARKGNGYIALYSQHPTRWLSDQDGGSTAETMRAYLENRGMDLPYAHFLHGRQEGQTIELRADSPSNIWVVEMGNAAQWGDFVFFVAAITGATIACDHLDVTYQSPSQGHIAFGWDKPLQIDGEAIALHDYPRFDNPYCQAEFGTRHYVIAHDGESITLDFGD